MSRTPRFLTIFLSLIALFCCFLLPIVVPNRGFAQGGPQTPSGRSHELNEKGVAAMKGKKLEAAEALFKRAVEADPYNLTAVFNLASAYLSNKKNAAAVSLLESYAEQTIDDPGIFVRLGDAYFASKRVPDALRSYEKASSKAPDYYGLWKKLGTVYALSNRNTDAERALRKALELDAQDGQLLSNLSSVTLANGKTDDAVSFAKRAIQIAPNADAYVTLGSAYERQGNIADAIISLKRAKDLGATARGLDEKLRQLEEKRP